MTENCVVVYSQASHTNTRVGSWILRFGHLFFSPIILDICRGGLPPDKLGHPPLLKGHQREKSLQFYKWFHQFKAPARIEAWSLCSCGNDSNIRNIWCSAAYFSVLNKVGDAIFIMIWVFSQLYGSFCCWIRFIREIFRSAHLIRPRWVNFKRE